MKHPKMLDFLHSQIREGIIYSDDKSAKPHDYEKMTFEGTIGDVYQRMRDILSSEYTETNHLDLYMTVPRLLRGIIDFGVEHPFSSFGEDVYIELKNRANEIANCVFSGNFGDAKTITERLFDDLDIDSGCPYSIDQIQSFIVKESADSTTWNSGCPDNIKNLISVLGKRSADVDILMIVGHGGYRSGYTIAAEIGAEPYPFRLSFNKKEDRGPQLFRGETEHILRMIKNKQVVFFDEDVYEGNTAMLVSFFAKEALDIEIPLIATTKMEYEFGRAELFTYDDMDDRIFV
ncbi:MAG: hypothetical protein ABIA21_01245 [Candidatus Aenigmatarchaeota archaeon]